MGAGKVPDVTAILVTYNRADSLELALRDILGQSLVDFRLVIADDASPDQTEVICRKWAAEDERITYVRRPNNLGMPNNLNAALRDTQSPYVAVLHDGNRYDSHAFELWHRALSEHPRVGFAFSQIAVMNASGITVSTYTESFSGVLAGKWLLRKGFFRRPGFDSPVFGVAMVRRTALERYGFLNPVYGFYADVDLWMGLLHEWDAAYVAQPLVRILPRQLQPHQFVYDPWELTCLMHDMFLRHRELEFADEAHARRYYEVALHYCFSYSDDAFHLLLMYRRGDFRSISASARYLRRNAKPLLPLRWLLLQLQDAQPFLFPRAARRLVRPSVCERT